MSAKAKNRRPRIQIRDVIYERYKSKIEEVDELDRKLEEVKKLVFDLDAPLNRIINDGKAILTTRTCCIDEIKFLREVLELPQT